MRILWAVIVTACCGFYSTWAIADTSAIPVPRFVSLKNQEVNLRAGPGYRYPIKWVYKKRHMPVEITEERGTWRKIKDIDGEQGWIHSTQLSGRRSALPLKAITAKRFPAQDAPPSFRADKGVVLYLQSCDKQWCNIVCENHGGWIMKNEVWGVYPDEIIEE